MDSSNDLDILSRRAELMVSSKYTNYPHNLSRQSLTGAQDIGLCKRGEQYSRILTL